MLITDDFVFLNYPKTGSTFTRTVIKEIHKQRLARRTLTRRCLDIVGFTPRLFMRELMLPNIKVSHTKQSRDQHGCYCQIPTAYANREVATVVRNPYTRFLSGYEFRWWKKFPLVPDSMLAEYFPSFPDLDIDDYVRLNQLGMVHSRLNGRSVSAKIGNQTVQFIQMFFKNPKDVLENISDDYMDSDRIFEDIAPITFLRQEQLNDELAAFLKTKGYSQKETDYIRQREKVNVTEKLVPNRNDLWTENALNYVQTYDRMIFKILASKGIEYGVPS